MMHRNGFNGHSGYAFLHNSIMGGRFHMILIIVAVIVVIGLIIWFRKRKKRQGNHALNMLKELFVKGEVTEEEYLKRKSVIERK